MIKGFITYNEGKIPFVINNYQLELFSDDDVLKNFAKENNYNTNYLLQGQCLQNGFQGQKITMLVDYSTGNICYLRCYIIFMLSTDSSFDSIGIQSSFLDDIFGYKYKYLDMVRAGINLSSECHEAYNMSFSLNDNDYELIYRLGHDHRLGLLEDFDKKGEIVLSLHSNDIQECYDISMVLYRFAMFMTSHAQVHHKYITLYKNGKKKGWFFCPLILQDTLSTYNGLFYELDVMKYIPKILGNIALDSGNTITQSIPLGHLGNFESLYSPQRFIEQIMSFEYLFEKLEPQKARDRHFSLKEELIFCFNMFPEILSKTNRSVDILCEEIKELRRNITHGYKYYYDFRNDSHMKSLIILLDKLLKRLSLKWIGFSTDEIQDFILF